MSESEPEAQSVRSLEITVAQLSAHVQRGLGLAAFQLDHIEKAQAHLMAALDGFAQEPQAKQTGCEDITEIEFDEEVIALDSDEAYEITRRYFWTRRGDPAAYNGLQEHLQKNGIAADNTKDLKQLMSYWMNDIQYDLADLGHHGRWTMFNGAQVFAEITVPTPPPSAVLLTHAPAASSQQPTIVPSAQDEFVKIVPEPEISFDVSGHLQTILAETHLRYNHVRRVLAESLGLDLETAGKCLDQALDDGTLFDFRYHGARNLTLDRAVALELNTERMRTKKDRTTRTPEQHPVIDSRTLLDIVSLFSRAGTHLQQAKTVQEISRELGIPLDAIKLAVRELRDDQILLAATRPLNKGGHRTASQLVTKYHLVSQELKDQLKQATNFDELAAALDKARRSNRTNE